MQQVLHELNILEATFSVVSQVSVASGNEIRLVGPYSLRE